MYGWIPELLLGAILVSSPDPAHKGLVTCNRHLWSKRQAVQHGYYDMHCMLVHTQLFLAAKYIPA